MALPAIKKQTAEQLATAALRAQILSGDILPGTRITEASISEQLDLSRGTVRIALYQLAQEGLVKQTPFTGWATTSLDTEDLWELYTLRAGLETTAARLLCERMDTDRAKALITAFEELERACETGKYTLIAQRDFQLHRTIVELASSKRLSEHYRLVEQQIRIFVASTYNFVAKPEDVLDHHRPFIDALLARDAELIDKLLRDHAISEGKRLFAHLVSIKGPAGDEGGEADTKDSS